MEKSFYYLCNRRMEVMPEYGRFETSSAAEAKFKEVLNNAVGDCPVCGIGAETEWE